MASDPPDRPAPKRPDPNKKGERELRRPVDGPRELERSLEGRRALDRALEGRKELERTLEGRRELERSLEGRRDALEHRKELEGALQERRELERSIQERKQLERSLLGREELERTMRQRQQDLGPFYQLELVRQALKAFRAFPGTLDDPARPIRQDLATIRSAAQGFDAARQARDLKLGSVATEFFRATLEMQMLAQRRVDVSNLTSLQAAMASVSSGGVVPITPSQSWKDLLLAARDIAQRPSAVSLAAELQARHPETSPEEIQTALVQEVAHQAAATTGTPVQDPLVSGEAEQIALATAEVVTALDQQTLDHVAASEEWLFGLLSWVVREIEERLPGFELNSTSIQVILSIVLWLVPNPYTIYQDYTEDKEAARRHAEAMAASAESARNIDGVTTAIKHEHALHTPRYRVTRGAVVRDGPARSAKAIERLTQGTIVIQREQQGRWLHVQADRPDGRGQFTGWVYGTNVELLPTDER